MHIFNSDDSMELITTRVDDSVEYAADPLEILIAREEFFAKCEELGIDPADYI